MGKSVLQKKIFSFKNFLRQSLTINVIITLLLLRNVNTRRLFPTVGFPTVGFPTILKGGVGDLTIPDTAFFGGIRNLTYCQRLSWVLH